MLALTWYIVWTLLFIVVFLGEVDSGNDIITSVSVAFIVLPPILIPLLLSDLPVFDNMRKPVVITIKILLCVVATFACMMIAVADTGAQAESNAQPAAIEKGWLEVTVTTDPAAFANDEATISIVSSGGDESTVKAAFGEQTSIALDPGSYTVGVKYDLTPNSSYTYTVPLNKHVELKSKETASIAFEIETTSRTPEQIQAETRQTDIERIKSEILAIEGNCLSDEEAEAFAEIFKETGLSDARDFRLLTKENGSLYSFCAQVGTTFNNHQINVVAEYHQPLYVYLTSFYEYVGSLSVRFEYYVYNAEDGGYVGYYNSAKDRVVDYYTREGSAPVVG